MEDTAQAIGRATYSPEDNKLRLYPDDRLDESTYSRFKELGFSWAPRQKLFVAPMWTPAREDILLEICGSIEDEDTTLAERAAERAERFEKFSTKRDRDGEAAQRQAGAVGERFAMGQPILIGHHSQRRAEKDKERIESSMRKAVSLFETAEYWQRRAEGALDHAAYKEKPAVRFRRIKGFESEIRKLDRQRDERAKHHAALMDPNLTREKLVYLCDYGLGRGVNAWDRLRKGEDWEALRSELIERYENHVTEWAARWYNHYRNRIAYERAMLGEQGAVVLEAQGWDIKPGGRVKIGSTWYTVLRPNKKDGKIVSVTVVGNNYIPVHGIEEVKAYEPPTEDQAAAVKKVNTLGPLVNLRDETCMECTAKEWKVWQSSGTAYVRQMPGTDEVGKHRRRVRRNAKYELVTVFITDAKEVPLPPPSTGPKVKIAGPERDADAPAPRVYQPREPSKAQLLKEALKGGVQVVSANQLFPTPSDLAARMVELADIQQDTHVLEPSAGTGRILDAIKVHAKPCYTVAVEINRNLADMLERNGQAHDTVCTDFLEWDAPEKFDRILMNPPFERGDDIKHILKARDLLKPGGTLVAICAGGPRQKEALEPLASLWEPLPAGTFQESGTNVNTVLLTIEA